MRAFVTFLFEREAYWLNGLSKTTKETAQKKLFQVLEPIWLLYCSGKVEQKSVYRKSSPNGRVRNKTLLDCSRLKVKIPRNLSKFSHQLTVRVDWYLLKDKIQCKSQSCGNLSGEKLFLKIFIYFHGVHFYNKNLYSGRSKQMNDFGSFSTNNGNSTDSFTRMLYELSIARPQKNDIFILL